MIVFDRAWAMPNSETFKIQPIGRFVGKYINGGDWVDPFARNSVFSRHCKATNDLDESVNTTHHMDALDFLNMFDENSVDGVLFDPPYSPRQISECYKSVGRDVFMEDTQSSFYTQRKRAAARIVRPGGHVLCFGWNSNGIGRSLGFELIEVLIVAHGGAHNDTICTAERKRTDLFSDAEAAE